VKGRGALFNEDTASTLLAITIFLADHPDVLLQIIKAHIIIDPDTLVRCAALYH